MAFGERDSREVRLTGELAAAARLEISSILPAGPEVSVLPAGDEKPQGLRVAMKGASVGRGAGQVFVETGLENPKELSLLYSWQVVGNLTIEPTNPYIDLRGAPPAQAVVRVSSRRRDFRLDEVRVPDGPFEATFVREEAANSYAVRVRVLAGLQGPEQRGVLGTLRFISNDPAEPQKDVPLFALGPAPAP